MDKYDVRMYKQAIRDIDNIYAYIAIKKLSPENAKGQADRIKEAILGLDTFPQAHQDRLIGAYAGKGYKQLLIDNYDDIMEYIGFLSSNDGTYKRSNQENGIARRIAALRQFFHFMCNRKYLKSDPTSGIETKRIPEHTIIRMTPSEVMDLMDTVNNSSAFKSKRQQTLCEKTRLRDATILTLLLNTGIRVSECENLDVKDLNFKENSFLVLRKGGKTQTLYFNEAVAATIKEYMEIERPLLLDPNIESEALFLSLKHSRMTVRSIERMVKKYTQAAVSGKNLTPHKMRSTYGTGLYQKTRDLYLVADVLGHKNINVTAKYYAAMDEENRMRAAEIDPYEK